jgi:hypothetical protein
VSDERRYDLRVVTHLDEPLPELLRFRDDVREFAARFYPDLEVRWVAEKRKRPRRRRPRIHPPPRDLGAHNDNDAGDEATP